MPIRLRPTTPADRQFVLAAEQHPDNRIYVGQWTAAEYRSALSDPDIRHQMVEQTENGQPVGFVMLAGLTSPHQNIELRRIVITEKGKGYGKATLRQIQQIVFMELGAHRLWLDVKDFNQRARSLYRSVGFVEEGLLRECLKTDRGYESLVLMSMLRQEFLDSFGSV